MLFGRSLFQLCGILMWMAGCFSSPIYPRVLVSTPLVWHSGEAQRVSINVFNMDNVTIRVHFVETGLQRQGLVKTKLLKDRGYPVTISLKVSYHYLPRNLWTNHIQHLHLVTNGTAGGRTVFMDIKQIRLHAAPCMVIAMTDRQVYRSDDKITVYAVTYDRHRSLSQNWVNCFVKSLELSKTQTHDLEYMIPTRAGYAQDQFSASVLGMAGKFGLHCRCPSQNKHRLLHRFLVQDPQPPTTYHGPPLFKVKISTVSCLTQKTRAITIKIKSKYSNGNPVIGTVTLRAAASHHKITITKPMLKTKLSPKNGRATLTLKINIPQKFLASTSRRDHKVTLIVRVKSAQTKQTKTVTAKILVTRSPWRYTLDASLKRYVPGETVTVKACAVDCQGRSADQVSFRARLISRTNLEPATQHQLIKLKARPNSGGCAEYRTQTGRHHQLEFVLENSSLSSTLVPLQQTLHRIPPGEFTIHLDSSKCRLIKVGQECIIGVFFSLPLIDGFLQYELSGGNQLISSSGQRLTVFGWPSPKTQIRLTATTQMPPEAKLTVIAYSNSTGMAAAEHIIQCKHKQNLRHEVFLWLNTKKLWPGQTSSLEVTGQPSSHVLIFAVPYNGQQSSWKNVTNFQQCTCPVSGSGVWWTNRPSVPGIHLPNAHCTPR